MAPAELAELQAQPPPPTPSPPRTPAPADGRAETGKTPRKAPAQLQGVSAEGLLPGLGREGLPLMPLTPGGPGGSNELPISFEGVGFKGVGQDPQPKNPCSSASLIAWGKEGEWGQEGESRGLLAARGAYVASKGEGSGQ